MSTASSTWVFQEYLAAREVRRAARDAGLVGNYGESWWQEVTRLLMGLENASSFVLFEGEKVVGVASWRRPKRTTRRAATEMGKQTSRIPNEQPLNGTAER